jgi:hypothetical protein
MYTPKKIHVDSIFLLEFNNNDRNVREGTVHMPETFGIKSGKRALGG